MFTEGRLSLGPRLRRGPEHRVLAAQQAASLLCTGTQAPVNLLHRPASCFLGPFCPSRPQLVQGSSLGTHLPLALGTFSGPGCPVLFGNWLLQTKEAPAFLRAWSLGLGPLSASW